MSYYKYHTVLLYHLMNVCVRPIKQTNIYLFIQRNTYIYRMIQKLNNIFIRQSVLILTQFDVYQNITNKFVDSKKKFRYIDNIIKPIYFKLCSKSKKHFELPSKNILLFKFGKRHFISKFNLNVTI